MTIQDARIIGNIGLHHTCCQIARHGWTVSLTRRGWKPISRNIRGVDIIIHNADSTSEITIQIITITDSKSIPFGNTTDDVSADFVVFCKSIENVDKKSDNHVYSIPDIFILSKEEIKKSVIKRSDGKKISYWLEESKYMINKDGWTKIGFA